MNIETDLHRQPVRLRHNPRYAPDSTRDGAAWQDEALCAQVDPVLFHPDEKGASIRAAQRICSQCPVAVPYLEANLGEQYGVFGGTSAKQRTAIRKTRAAQARTRPSSAA